MVLEPACGVGLPMVEEEEADGVGVTQGLRGHPRVVLLGKPGLEALGFVLLGTFVGALVEVGGNVGEDGGVGLGEALVVHVIGGVPAAILGCPGEVHAGGVAHLAAAVEGAPGAEGRLGGARELGTERFVRVGGELLELGHGASFVSASLAEGHATPGAT